jgi:hypothetical protein
MIKFPSLDLSSYIHLPEANHTILVPTDSPSAIWTNTQASYTSFIVRKFQRSVVGEWLETIWAGQLWNQAVGINIQLGTLNTGSKIQVKLTTETLLDESVICRDQSQSRVLLGKIVLLSIFRVVSFPFGALCVGRQVFFGRII